MNIDIASLHNEICSFKECRVGAFLRVLNLSCTIYSKSCIASVFCKFHSQNKFLWCKSAMLSSLVTLFLLYVQSLRNWTLSLSKYWWNKTCVNLEFSRVVILCDYQTTDEGSHRCQFPDSPIGAQVAFLLFCHCFSKYWPNKTWVKLEFSRVVIFVIIKLPTKYLGVVSTQIAPHVLKWHFCRFATVFPNIDRTKHMFTLNFREWPYLMLSSYPQTISQLWVPR